MKVLVIIIMLVSITAFAQDTKPVKIKKQVVEASCGVCMFNIEGDNCELAVKIDGKVYFVKGSNIDDHGDAHAHDGFCHKIRKAEVSGEIVNDRFEVMYFKLLAVNKEDDEDHDHDHNK